jgi:hypothetical protein
VTAAWDAAWSTAICPDIVVTLLEIVVTVPDSVLTIFVRDTRDPERFVRLLFVVVRLVFVVRRAPERVL